MNWVLKKQVKVQSHKGPHPWHAILVGKRHKQTTFQKSLNIPARSQWNFGHLELPRSQCIFHLVLRLHARWPGRGMILSSAHLQKRAPRFKFYKNDLQEWDVSIANLVKAKHGETHEKPSFHRPSFFLLNTILKIVILLTFGAKTGSRLFLGKLLHQHPWHGESSLQLWLTFRDFQQLIF